MYFYSNVVKDADSSLRFSHVRSFFFFCNWSILFTPALFNEWHLRFQIIIIIIKILVALKRSLFTTRGILFPLLAVRSALQTETEGNKVNRYYPPEKVFRWNIHPSTSPAYQSYIYRNFGVTASYILRSVHYNSNF